MLLLLLLLLGACQVMGQVAPPLCDGRYQYYENSRRQLMGIVSVKDPCGATNMTVQITSKMSAGRQLQEGANIRVNEYYSGLTPMLYYYLTFPLKTPRPKIIKLTFNNRPLCLTEVPLSEVNYTITLTHTMRGRRRDAGCSNSNHALASSSAVGLSGAADSDTDSEVTLSPMSDPSEVPPPPPLPTRRPAQTGVGVGSVPGHSQVPPPRPPSSGRPSPPTRPPARRPTQSGVSVGSVPGHSQVPPPQPPRLSTRRQAQSTTTMKPPAQEERKKNYCGLSVRPQPLMLGGRDVEKGDWPWVIPLFDLKTSDFKCAGILVSKRFVVIAAHCVIDPVAKTKLKKDELVLMVGKFNFLKWAERDVQPLEVRRIILHPDFSAAPLMNDIAMLYMEDDVDYTMYARPICLEDNDVTVESLVGQEGTMIGWNPGGVLPRSAKAPIVSRQQCSAFAGQVADRTFCAGNTTASEQCIGDGDGGLLLSKVGDDRSLRWFLRGIPSSHLQNDPAACKRGGYVVFTDVAPYVAWIRQVVTTTRPYDYDY